MHPKLKTLIDSTAQEIVDDVSETFTEAGQKRKVTAHLEQLVTTVCENEGFTDSEE